jgi:hypothetical protein
MTRNHSHRLAKLETHNRTNYIGLESAADWAARNGWPPYGSAEYDERWAREAYDSQAELIARTSDREWIEDVLREAQAKHDAQRPRGGLFG